MTTQHASFLRCTITVLIAEVVAERTRCAPPPLFSLAGWEWTFTREDFFASRMMVRRGGSGVCTGRFIGEAPWEALSPTVLGNPCIDGVVRPG